MNRQGRKGREGLRKGGVRGFYLDLASFASLVVKAFENRSEKHG